MVSLYPPPRIVPVAAQALIARKVGDRAIRHSQWHNSCSSHYLGDIEGYRIQVHFKPGERVCWG